MQTTILINQAKLIIKNPQKIFWPEDNFTKADVMKYYADMWSYLSPHIHNRPVSLVRYPNGITGDFFYQKNIPNPPPWVQTFPVQSDQRMVNYGLINNLETLIWMVNLGCIEVHPWLSAVDSLDSPSYIIFDLDPMEPAVFNDAVRIALYIKSILDALSLKSFPKISGATGIHIYLPVKKIYTFTQTSSFVKKIGEIIIKSFPDLATNERKVTDRTGKVYIDHLQNLSGKTIASVYSLRPFPGAPASLPVYWEELPDVHPLMFNIRTAPKRVQKIGDLFKPLLSFVQELPEKL